METVHVFVSYSHEDEFWVKEGPHGLIPWLARALGKEVRIWCDHALKELPGEDYKKLIKSEIDRAHFAVLLISQDFANSEFIRQYELPWIRVRVDRNELGLIPILAGPVCEEDLDWLADRQLLPGKPTPLIDYTECPRKWKEVQVQILKALRHRIRELRESWTVGQCDSRGPGHEPNRGDAASVPPSTPPPASSSACAERESAENPARPLRAASRPAGPDDVGTEDTLRSSSGTTGEDAFESNGKSELPDDEFHLFHFSPDDEQAEESIAVVDDWESGDKDQDQDQSALLASIVHEHRATGFYADLFVPEERALPSNPLSVVFEHKLLGPKPVRIDLRLPESKDPIQYVRLPGLIHGFPVTLRLYWLARTKSCYSFSRWFAKAEHEPIHVNSAPDQTRNLDEIGILVKRGMQFRSIIPTGSMLPCVVRGTRKTTRDFQSAVSLSAAVRTEKGLLKTLWKMTVPVLPLRAREAWVQFAFRLDPDGRFTLVARNPARQMMVEDVLVVGSRASGLRSVR